MFVVDRRHVLRRKVVLLRLRPLQAVLSLLQQRKKIVAAMSSGSQRAGVHWLAFQFLTKSMAAEIRQTLVLKANKRLRRRE